MSKETGGPAFPVTREMIGPNDTFNVVATEGMTLRDWFVGQALAGTLANPNLQGWSAWQHVDFASIVADCVIAERAK